MPRISVSRRNDGPSNTPFIKKAWNVFWDLDKFTKMSIVTMLVILLATPTIISTRQIFEQHAADSTSYIATAGAVPVFSIDNLTPNQQSVSEVTLSWTTSAPAKCRVLFWENNLLQNFLSLFSLPQATFYEAEPNTNHEFTVAKEGLKPNTAYNYKIYAVSSDGEEFVSKTYTFTTSQ